MAVNFDDGCNLDIEIPRIWLYLGGNEWIPMQVNWSKLGRVACCRVDLM